MAQQTLEEAAEEYARNKYDNWNLHPDDHFLAGAKWQQERMLKLHEDWEIYTITNFHPDFKRLSFKSYIEQFSK
jgi:hypothetical protein